MKFEMRAGAALLALAISMPAAAQDAPSPAPQEAAAGAPVVSVQEAPAAAPVQSAALAPNTLTKGTEIQFVTLNDLSSQFSKVGQTFDLEVAADVSLDGRVAIAKGSRGKGAVTFVKKKGSWGKSGKLEAKVLFVNVNGIDVPVDGMVGDKGKNGTGAVVGVVLLSPLIVAPFAGFFVTGTSAVLPHGSPAAAVLVSDLTVVPAASIEPAVAAEPAAVPASAPVAAPATQS